MTTTINIELSKLDADPKNVRKTYSAESIAALAASIRVNGVLQNLVVRTGDKKGRYFVTAGERRRRALLLLLEQGEIQKSHAVECKVRDGEDATEISLTENVMREDMHPVDAYEAFSALADQGKAIPDIAARFGTTEIIVRRRLALAKVSPKLLDLFRDEKMTFEQLSAFTVSDDHERQEQVWNGLSTWDRQAHRIKSNLLTDQVASTDRRVKFVGGLDAYEQAGGSVRRDLFDADGGGYALDVALLDRLVSEKLDEATVPYRVQGWKWVEATYERPEWMFNVPRIYPVEVELSAEVRAEYDALCEEHDELAELINNDAGEESAHQRVDAINQRLDEISESRETYLVGDKARSGVVLYVNYHGKLEAAIGVINNEGEAGDESDTENENGNASASVEAKDDTPKLTHPATLIEDLTAQKTAALRVELVHNPDVALAAVVHAMLLRVAYTGYVSEQSVLQLSLTYERVEASMKSPETCAAVAAFESLSENYGHKIPGNPADLFDWCLQQSREELLLLLAYAAAHAVNAVEKKFTDRRSGIEQANQLGRALNVQMTDWFETTADSYFSHINRQSIAVAVTEAKGEDAGLAVKAAAKKTEAVVIADRLVKGTGWLPAPIRIAVDPNAEADVEANNEAQSFPMAAE
ncbi:ParB/RepB/Spo0J family partition protein (plasmid) [Agrobacterium rosae]|uniref:ParB/RepB/Spo0J family partition protein n=1 Tax=Agrobacterium rosae TaxID=1972867 RepID=A0ABU4W4F6_9HYPH|nr:ParB/RepB/Spo0J family partition protein [Agrobacterium rosae]MDX8331861.1 ParB/RepB/Spo0J family partition protein [Agrobacterium rosae]